MNQKMTMKTAAKLLLEDKLHPVLSALCIHFSPPVTESIFDKIYT